jgi:hypothetical protein
MRKFCRGLLNIIPVKFGSNWHSSFTEKDFLCILANQKQKCLITCRHSKFLFLLDQYTKEWFSVVFSSETTVTGVSKLYRNGVSKFLYKNLFPILLHCDTYIFSSSFDLHSEEEEEKFNSNRVPIIWGYAGRTMI